MTCELTVFTPTFNRGYILEKLYESLVRQTSKNFEWIIIDDASTDNTEEMVDAWINSNNCFNIYYKKVGHGGKHRAFNKAVCMAHAPAFFAVDSDDYLTDDAVEKAIEWFTDIKDNEEFAGVSGMRGYTLDRPIGGTGNIELTRYIDATNIEREEKTLQGDKAEIYKISVLRRYPFQEFDDEDFITEATVWDLIAINGYKIRWHNEIIYITKYLEDGLTHKGNEIFYINPKGWLYWLWVKSQYKTKSSVFLDYFCWYIYNCNTDLINEMPEYYRNKASAALEYIVSFLNKYIEENNIKNYVIYGLGNYGEIFWRFKDKINATMLTVVDSNKILWKEFTVCKPNVLSNINADFILVTMKSKNGEVVSKLNKLEGHVVYLADVLSNFIQKM